MLNEDTDFVDMEAQSHFSKLCALILCKQNHYKTEADLSSTQIGYACKTTKTRRNFIVSIFRYAFC